MTVMEMLRDLESASTIVWHFVQAVQRTRASTVHSHTISAQCGYQKQVGECEEMAQGLAIRTVR